jgi:uncharacterized protein YndB with AHSA1/START domain/ketosteroid isomerase-like protein
MSSLTIIKTIAARPEIVFDALIQPEGLKMWIGPDDGPVLIAESDARVGGKFKLRFQMLDGSEHEATGEYLEVDRPRKLAMTWAWQNHEDRTVSRIDVSLRSIATGTELTFTHSQLPNDKERDGHREGWNGALDKLVRALDKGAIASKMSAWASAITAKDADAVAKHFASGAVAFDLAPPLKHVGFDRKALETWFGTWDGPIGYEITDQEIQVSDTLAVARSLDHMTGRKADGENVSLWTRSTVCFRKQGASWDVFHVHSSVPMLMDGSGKAATGLKP